MSNLRLIVSLAIIATVLITSNAFAFVPAKKKTATFKVRVENVSPKGGLTAADGSNYPFALSPGFYEVTEDKADFFTVGKKASAGLEMQAEDGDPAVLSRSVMDRHFVGSSGVFNLPVGADMPSPILPANSYEFMFHATEGMKLNLIAMYGQSNDLFYAPAKPIELFDGNGNPVTGDVTGEFQLWDAGTEVNEAPGIGPDQAPRQKMKNTGAAENGVVGLVKDGFTYPNTKDVLRITITAN